ncbi:hypothetical protein HPP92_028744 [Vanilla planifolia]|uniref:Uncharacterized protein n=1 Tax=Vanilla planifolia TaxID=51239 RepID=A0A835P811_VANPL|nr:hypothetical protein HPP92_028744 [Vanilla planifolia]KAG0446655.1 hypothetical protein HPP92_028733 [Vanilla planifolia]
MYTLISSLMVSKASFGDAHEGTKRHKQAIMGCFGSLGGRGAWGHFPSNLAVN